MIVVSVSFCVDSTQRPHQFRDFLMRQPERDLREDWTLSREGDGCYWLTKKIHTEPFNHEKSKEKQIKAVGFIHEVVRRWEDKLAAEFDDQLYLAERKMVHGRR